MRRKFIKLPVLLAGLFIFCVSLEAKPTQLNVDFNSVTPEQQLADAFRVASSGNVIAGLDAANRTVKTYSTDVKTKLRYIETLIRMQKLPGEEHDITLINSAIRASNEIRTFAECNGSRDPAMGFGYLQSLGELAYLVEAKHPETCNQLKQAVGRVAENLLVNPLVSQESHKYLALPFFDKARAHANVGEEQLAAESLQVAFKLGFADFERAKKEESFKKLTNSEEIDKIIEDGHNLVTNQKQKWAATEIAGFSPYPFVFDVDGLDDGHITNHDFRGKILVVDLWATWCPPCKKGIPHFKKLQREFSDQNVAVLGISVGNPDSPLSTRTEVQEFVKAKKFNYPCGLGGHSVLSQIPGETSLPTTLFIDEEGQVRYVIRGYHEYADLEALTEQMIKISEAN